MAVMGLPVATVGACGTIAVQDCVFVVVLNCLRVLFVCAFEVVFDEERVALLLEPFCVVAASLRGHGVSSRREDGVGEPLRHAPALTFAYYTDMLRELPRATGLKRGLS